MKTKVFCTIITQSHLPYVLALHDSLKNQDNTILLNVLVIDTESRISDRSDSLIILALKNIAESSYLAQEVINKYNSPLLQDELRWSLKPIFINYLLAQGFEKVIFTDPDTYYFSDYSFLFDELDDNNILLTPHWRGLTPNNNEANFNLQFVGGLFNAGFIGVNKHAKAVMDWWAEMCLYRCEMDFSTGHYVDQTYLNLMPVYFDKVKILKHQGCNVASWNQLECKRILRYEDTVWINDLYSVVFIHFTVSTISGILNGDDKLLLPYLEAYNKVLLQNGLKENLLDKCAPKQKVKVKPSISKRIIGKLKKLLH